MRYIILVLLFLTFAIKVFGVESEILPTISPTPAPPIEYALPYPGILPDHPLYFLKKMRDSILLLLTKDPVKKSQLHLLLSDKHLVMGQLLWEKSLFDLSINTLENGEKYLLMGVLDLGDRNKVDDLPPGLVDKLELASKKHEELIMKLIASTNEEKSRYKLIEVLGITHQAIQKMTMLKAISK